jgi:hypothetical protein
MSAPKTGGPARGALDFASINGAALSRMDAVLARLLPGGRVVAGEYLALNPRRADKHLGSFKVRVNGPRAGAWADFAAGVSGGDPISLIAYIAGSSQGDAARSLASMLGIETRGRRNG